MACGRRQSPQLVNLHSFGLVARLVNTQAKWPPYGQRSPPLATAVHDISHKVSFSRCVRDPFRVPRIKNRVTRTSENDHRVPGIRENRVHTGPYQVPKVFFKTKLHKSLHTHHCLYMSRFVSAGKFHCLSLLIICERCGTMDLLCFPLQPQSPQHLQGLGVPLVCSLIQQGACFCPIVEGLL